MDKQAEQPKLTFRFSGQEQKRTMTVDEFKKLCGNSSRLFDVMKFKGKTTLLTILTTSATCRIVLPADEEHDYE